MNPQASPKICIVGGGLSGLATASKLQRLLPNAAIEIREATHRVGGVIHTERLGSYLVDHGADMFATNPPAAIQLCEELGVSNQLMQPLAEDRGAKIVCEGRLVPLPEGFVLMRATQLMPMLRTPLLSVTGKVRFLVERWIPRRRKAGIQHDDESIGEFVSRRMGREMLDRIVAPLTAGIYTADINRLSMLATMGPIAEMEAKYGSLAKATAARRRTGQDSVERNSTGARYSQFRAFQGGMIQLIQSLVDDLPAETIHTDSPVQKITPRKNGGWQVDLTKKSLLCDELVLATPPQVSAKLLQDQCAVAAKLLGEIEASSVAIVILGVDQSQIKKPANCFGFVVPLQENKKILACSFASAKFAERAPMNKVLIRVFVGGAMQPELLTGTDQAIISLVREELAQLIGLGGEPEVAKVVRWNNAMPQYHVGHLDRIEKIEQAIEPVQHLTMISNAFHGVGIAPLISQAEKVAKTIAGRYQK